MADHHLQQMKFRNTSGTVKSAVPRAAPRPTAARSLPRRSLQIHTYLAESASIHAFAEVLLYYCDDFGCCSRCNAEGPEQNVDLRRTQQDDC